MIVGDFNIHVDDSTDIQAGKLHDIIASHSLHQHVTSPTHTQGHTLDLVITHDNQTISVHPVYPPLLSMFVVADCDCLSPSMESASTRRVRNWRALHVDTFAAELQCSELVATPPSGVGSDNVMCISLSACLFAVNCTMCIQEYAAVRIIKRRACRKVMAAYTGRVYAVTCGLTAENRDQLQNPTLVSCMRLPVLHL